MNRKQFLRGSSLALLGSLVRPVAADSNRECVLIPRETAGPFPLDLTDNEAFFRQDVRESELGAPLRLRLKIVGLDNCLPMQDVRVHIWQCDRNGVYSGYNTGSNPGDRDATHLRGYQLTDVHGEVEFLTVFPGWYPGRICHIHFQVFVSSSYSAVSQLTFPLEPRSKIYADHPNLYPRGDDPLDFASDISFADDHQLQLATLTFNEETQEYDSYLEATVQGSGTTGIGHLERQIKGVFEMGQNAPNPYRNFTTIPLKLKQAAQLNLSLWNLAGQRVGTVIDEHRPAGDYTLTIVPADLGLPPATYIYQLEATTTRGTFRLPRVMTSA